MLNLRRILVPVDFSDEAALALSTAVTIGKSETSPTIFLLHVLPIMVDSAYLVAWTDDLVALRWEQAKRDLEEWRRRVPASMRCIPLLRHGIVAKQVCQTCRDKAIDLVVMTTRGRRGLARMMNPNASEETVRSAPCPVVVLHLNRREADTVQASAQRRPDATSPQGL